MWRRVVILGLLAIYPLNAQQTSPRKQEQKAQPQKNPIPCPPVNVSCQCATNQAQPDAAKDSQQSPSWFWGPIRETWPLVMVGLLAIAAAWATYGIMRDTARRQLRAYVHVKEGLLKFSGSTVEGQIHIQNFGQTPAYDVRHWIYVCVERWPLATVLPQPPEDFQMSKGILAPSGKHIMVGQLDDDSPAPELTLGQNPTRTVYVYGRITYKDAFGDDKYTEYRLTYGGRQAGRKFIDTNHVLCGRLQDDFDGNKAT